jgi:hypothetical protein
MAERTDFWFRVGYALERAAQSSVRRTPRLASISQRKVGDRKAKKGEPGLWALLGDDPGEAVRTIGLGIMGRLTDRRVSRPTLWVGATAGAAVAATRAIIRPLVQGDTHRIGEDVIEEALRGAAHGMVYAAVVAPWLPGPVLVRGTIYGVASYLASSVGGLPRLLGPISPHRHVPFLSTRVAPDPVDEALWEHLLLGIGLAAAYESSASSRGTSVEG